MTDIINNLVHPKVVEAFLVSPTFTTKLPKGIQLFLRPNYPVRARDTSNATVVDSLQDEKFTWAIVDERAGTHTAYVVSGALVEPELTDDEFDALDSAIATGTFRAYLGDDGQPCFVVEEKEVATDDPRHRIFTLVLNTAGISNAAGIKVILANGPRWVLVETAEGLSISRSVGKRADGSVLDPEGPNTSMYGGLVSQAFEAVVTRDAFASLQAAKAAAGR